MTLPYSLCLKSPWSKSATAQTNEPFWGKPFIGGLHAETREHRETAGVHWW